MSWNWLSGLSPPKGHSSPGLFTRGRGQLPAMVPWRAAGILESLAAGCSLTPANEDHPDDITSVPSCCTGSDPLGIFVLLTACYRVPPSPSPTPTSEYLGCLWEAHFQNTWRALFLQRERAVQSDVNFSPDFHILLMIQLSFSSLHSCCIHVFPVAY